MKTIKGSKCHKNGSGEIKKDRLCEAPEHAMVAVSNSNCIAQPARNAEAGDSFHRHPRPQLCASFGIVRIGLLSASPGNHVLGVRVCF